MSYRAYARYRGVSPEAVSKAVKTGRITVDANGRIDPERADREWLANTNPAKAFSSVINKQEHRERVGLPSMPGTDAPAPGMPSFSQSRTIREAYEARLAKLEYEVKSGKLVNADEVRVTAFNVARITRDRLMGIPDKVSPIIAGMTEAHEIHTLLSREIRVICLEISDSATSSEGILTT